MFSWELLFVFGVGGTNLSGMLCSSHGPWVSDLTSHYMGPSKDLLRLWARESGLFYVQSDWLVYGLRSLRCTAVVVRVSTSTSLHEVGTDYFYLGGA